MYSKPPFADTGQVLAYLGRYTHKTAIGNHRLIDFDGEHVRFRWRDYADGNRRKVMRLEADEFIGRFLLHVLPRGFTRLNHYFPHSAAPASPRGSAQRSYRPCSRTTDKSLFIMECTPLSDRNGQNERGQPACLPQGHAPSNRRRPPGLGHRSAAALGLYANLKLKARSCRGTAYNTMGVDC